MRDLMSTPTIIALNLPQATYTHGCCLYLPYLCHFSYIYMNLLLGVFTFMFLFFNLLLFSFLSDLVLHVTDNNLLFGLLLSFLLFYVNGAQHFFYQDKSKASLKLLDRFEQLLLLLTCCLDVH